MMLAKETKSVCCYCGVGCGVIIESADDHITGVRGDPRHPANYGRLCTKGTNLHLTATSSVNRQVRALYPEIRNSRNEARSRSDWDTALNLIAGKFATIINEHGPDAVAFYISGQLLTEDYYVFNKLAKGLIGTNNIDTNSRLCMSSAVAGYKQTLGADAPPCCYEDFDHAEVIFIAGSNTAHAHPILFQRIEAAKVKNPKLALIVVDPRRTITAESADIYLPILPGTDVALFNGMLHILLWENLIDTKFIVSHTEGFEELKRNVSDYTPKFVSKICGIRQEELTKAACLFGESRATLSLYCQGLNQSASGTAKNAALINLHLATGHIGRKGAGPFSLTGQSNAMGGREVGGMANLLSAHRDMSNPEHRAEVSALWKIPDVPSIPGKTAVEMFDAIESGEIKAIWIACTNPAYSMPDQGRVHKALAKAQFVVVQEAYRTTTTVEYADALLPATSWGEKDGTVTNSERCISRVLPAVPGPGEARHDWHIVTDFAHRLEAMLRPDHSSLFPYYKPEDIWNEHRDSTRGRDLDITGLTYAILEQQGPQQWPFPSGQTFGRKRLYEDDVFATKNGRAQFVNTVYKPVADMTDAKFPIALTTGRLRDQWHGMSRTGTVAKLFGHAPEPCIDISRSDAARQFLKEGDLINVTSRRGSVILPVHISDELRSGQAFIAMHWGGEFLGGGKDIPYGINGLTTSAFDPSSKQPELKHSAVKIQKTDLNWKLLIFARMDQEKALAAQRELKIWRSHFAYSTNVLFGHEDSGILFRAAAQESPQDSLLDELNNLFGLGTDNVLRFRDLRRRIRRDILVENNLIKAVSLTGTDTSAGIWLKDYLTLKMSVKSLGQLLLIPGSQPPGAYLPQGKMVCNCFSISESRITESFTNWGGTPENMVTRLKNELKGGTNCGSCLPEIIRLAEHCHKNRN